METESSTPAKRLKPTPTTSDASGSSSHPKSEGQTTSPSSSSSPSASEPAAKRQKTSPHLNALHSVGVAPVESKVAQIPVAMAVRHPPEHGAPPPSGTTTATTAAASNTSPGSASTVSSFIPPVGPPSNRPMTPGNPRLPFPPGGPAGGPSGPGRHYSSPSGHLSAAHPVGQPVASPPGHPTPIGPPHLHPMGSPYPGGPGGGGPAGGPPFQGPPYPHHFPPHSSPGPHFQPRHPQFYRGPVFRPPQFPSQHPSLPRSHQPPMSHFPQPPPQPPPNPPPGGFNNPPMQPIYRSWTEDQVFEWFRSTFSFADEYLGVFRECAVDGPSLEEITRAILVEDMMMDNEEQQNAVLTAIQALKAGDGQPVAMMNHNLNLVQGGVTDDQLRDAIQQIVANGDLDHLTKKQIRYSLENKFGVTMTSKTAFIAKEVLRLISLQEDDEERKRQAMAYQQGVAFVPGNDTFTHNCHYCKMRFVNPQKLIHHMNTHKAVLPFECKHCGQRSKRRDKNERHEATSHRHKCPVCSKPFVWKRHSRYLSLEYHLEEVHGMSLELEQVDGNVMRKPPQSSPCPLCDRTFNTQELLRLHMQQHIGKKQFRCPQHGCYQRFANYQDLIAHSKIHLSHLPPGQQGFSIVPVPLHSLPNPHPKPPPLPPGVPPPLPPLPRGGPLSRNILVSAEE